MALFTISTVYSVFFIDGLWLAGDGLCCECCEIEDQEKRPGSSEDQEGSSPASWATEQQSREWLHVGEE